MVALVHVSNVLGSRLDAAFVAELTHKVHNTFFTYQPQDVNFWRGPTVLFAGHACWIMGAYLPECATLSC